MRAKVIRHPYAPRIEEAVLRHTGRVVSPPWLPPVVFALLAIGTLTCTHSSTTLFTPLSADDTGITFNNVLVETDSLNILTYEYLYNGAGIGVGDLNNDGLPDIYFSGNTVDSKLYLNQGKLRFDDVTASAHVSGKRAWKTGVSLADVNGDGWLDIYVCYSGLGTDADRADQLFINDAKGKGIPPTFTERAREYGLDAPGTFTTQAAFFDYDRDGDLDLFQLNHANTFYSPFFNTRKLRQTRHPQFGSRLYRNNGGHFVDVSTQAGILGSGLNYGLGVAISDLNDDGFPDIYVTSDYEEQDFCYLNNQHGGFTESLKSSFAHISKYAMGVDIADINNDDRPDVVTLDMLPEDNHRQKLLRGPDEYDKYQLAVDSGYHRQQMRNMLQLNQGPDPDGTPRFSEIGQLAGIAATDWSWSALLADYDNDGYKDLFITNGYVRDFTNLDFLKYDFADARAKAAERGQALYQRDGKPANRQVLLDLTQKIPATKVRNYLYHNKGNLTFSDQTRAWGIDQPTVSTGAAYADLDNDGDLDLIVNNTNERASIYRNNADQLSTNHYLRLKLAGQGKNRMATGATVSVTTAGGRQRQECVSVRGYQSSMDPVVHVGLGQHKLVQEIRVIWPGGRVSTLRNIPADTTLTIREAQAKPSPVPPKFQPDQSVFTDVTAGSKLAFVHQENPFVDFKSEPLALAQLSRQGPTLTKGDVNGDGREDLFVGGAAGQAGRLFLLAAGGTFSPAPAQPWQRDAACEDTGSLLFDADMDGDLDLYIVSGGNEFSLGSPELQDRLYINNGLGSFTKAPGGTLPQEFASGSCITASDYDHDGDVDLYVGGGVSPGQYPLCSPGGILRNDTDRTTKQVRFTVATPQVCPALKQPGIVADALWADVDGDTWADLLLVGEWMPVRLFMNRKGILSEQTGRAGLDRTHGYWRRIVAADMDRDGDLDVVLGNLGLNSPLKASDQEPLRLYAGDFNGDGRIDPILCNYVQGVSYPIASRDELLDQLTPLRKTFTSYASYADATIDQVLTKEQMAKANQSSIYTLQSSYLENRCKHPGGLPQFTLRPLPMEAQFSVVNGIVPHDFTGDGVMDLLLAGNYYPFRAQYGPYDASLGLLLAGDGRGQFKPVNRARSGLFLSGDVRALLSLGDRSDTYWIVAALNNGPIQVLRTNMLKFGPLCVLR